MTVYIITILFAVILSSGIKQRDKGKGEKFTNVFFLTLIIVWLALIVGYRYDVGTDFWSYKKMFLIYKDYSWAEIVKLKEPGIKVLIKFCSLFSADYSFYMFVCALITTSIPVIVLYKYSDNFILSIMLYLFLNYLTQCNGMRQSLAVSIVFMGYKYIKEKSFWKFLIFVLMGSIFHISSLFMVPIYFIYISKPSFWTTFLVLLITLILRFSYDWLVGSVEFFAGEEFESNSYTGQAVNILRVVAMCAPLVLVLFLSKNKFQSHALSFNLLLINACVYVCMGGSAYFARLGMFTNIFLCMAIPDIASEFDTKDRELTFLIVLSCYAIFFIVNTMRTGNLIPYQSVLW